MPIFKAAGLLVLRTMVGEGDAVGESDGDVEKLEEEEEAYRVSYEDAEEVV